MNETMTQRAERLGRDWGARCRRRGWTRDRLAVDLRSVRHYNRSEEGRREVGREWADATNVYCRAAIASFRGA